MNVIVYFVTAIVDINKLSINISMFEIIKMNVSYINWLGFVIHRNITMSLVLLIFVNIYLTTKKGMMKWVAVGGTFLILIFGGQLLQKLDVLHYTGWNNYYELICNLGLMYITKKSAQIALKFDGGIENEEYHL